MSSEPKNVVRPSPVTLGSKSGAAPSQFGGLGSPTRRSPEPSLVFFSCLFAFLQGCALSRHLSFNSSAEQCAPSRPPSLPSRSSPPPLRLASAVSLGRSVGYKFRPHP